MTDELADAWLEWCEAEGIARNTVARRRSVLRSLPNAGTATREQVEAWWEQTRTLAPSSRANALACLRAFYRWAQRWEHRSDDPTLRLDAPKVAAGLPRPMSRADLHKLLEALEAEPWLVRAVCLGAYAGLRVSEAAALDWSDVDEERYTLRVTGKGGKTRIIAVSPLLLDRLGPRPKGGGNVLTAGGEAISAANLQQRVNRAIKGAGVDATFHQLRHRFGTVAFQVSGDLVTVGRMMGHSSITTTAVYAAGAADAEAKIAAAVMR